jgi:RNA polymerase sigma-70 factor (ECF subfamily)
MSSDAQSSAVSSLHLLTRARAGDRAALDQLLHRYLPAIRRWATGRLPSWARTAADTDDVVQDAIIKTLRRVDAFEPEHDGALQAYLRQAVLNRIRDELRRAKRQPPGEPLSDDHAAARERSPLEHLIGCESIARYESALARLRPTDTQLIIARVELGLSYEEIMRAHRRPTLHATRVAVWRALARLAREMARTDPTEPATAPAADPPARHEAPAARLTSAPSTVTTPLLRPVPAGPPSCGT